MSVSIRLSRTGSKNNALYRIIVGPTRSKRDGKNLEVLGSYNPKTKTHEINKERFDLWVKNGAIISEGFKKAINK